ncbi:hypothetical protein ACTMTI_48240 [Nonomuraea sp. H19]|uniref:hypothetical protein n=1 Tax=Nonomuraea sp. H19 TaxID=3452206 RepID=UPI003F8A82F6
MTVASAVLASLILGNGAAILGVWLDGRATSDLLMFGNRMALWGRFGKVLQFVAGLSAILDLLDPVKLQESGERARERYLEASGKSGTARRKQQIVKLRVAIYRTFLVVVPDPHRVREYKQVKVGAPPADIPGDGLFERQVYVDFWHDVSAGMPRDEGERVDYVWRSADEFLARHLPAADVELLEQVIAQDDRGWRGFGRGSLVMMVILGLMFWRARLAPQGSVEVFVVIFVGVWAATGALFLTMALTKRGPTLWWWCRARGTALLAKLLDAARDQHVFRQLALGLFVLGFYFDLLSS